MKKYNYKPEARTDDFYEGVRILLKKGFPVTIEAPVGEGSDEIKAKLSSRGLKVSNFKIDALEFGDYLKKAEYISKYPGYYPSNLPQKAIEHYVGFKILSPTSDDLLIDIASENSPLAEICERLYGTKAYSQDIMYPSGIHGNRIGSDACAIPVENGFATKAILTCSLEHFESDSDTLLFLELHRVLKPGGMVLVIPFYIHSTAFILTDPSISSANPVIFDKNTILYCREGWGNRHGRHYSPETFSSRIAEKLSGKFSFEIFYITNARDIYGNSYAGFAFSATKLR